MFLALLTSLIRICASALVSKDLGTVYLYPNEIYQANLYDYFQGTFLNFSLEPETSSFSQIKNSWNLESLNSIPIILKNLSDPITISTYASRKFDFTISASGLKLTYFIMSISSGNGEKIFTIPIETNLVDSKITKAKINSNFILVIVNGMDATQGDYLNELYYIDIFLFRVHIKKIPIWDLRYVKDLNMKFTVISYIFFWGNLYGKNSIFYCEFDLSKLIVKQQISQFYEFKYLTPLNLDILDLTVYLDKLIVLQRDLGLVIFVQSEDCFFQHSFVLLRSYGRPIKLSNSNNQLKSLMYFAVLMNSGIIVIEYSFLRIRFIVPLNLDSNAYLQIFSPYLFVFLPENLEIYYFQDYQYSTLHRIPLEGNLSAVSILQNINGFSIIKQNYTHIEFFSLNFTLALLQVTGRINDSVIVLAQDEKSQAQSRINVTIIEDLYAVHLISNYRESKFNFKDVYFNSLNTYSDYNVFGTVSGWNLTLNLHESEQEFVSYNFSVKFPYNIIAEFNITEEYFTILYYYSFFYINDKGLYCNNSLILSIPTPLNLTAGNEMVQVLYPKKITIFYILTKNFLSLEINSNCSSVFKLVSIYTFCADNEKLFIIYYDNIYGPFYYSFITNNEQIIDVSSYEDSLATMDYIYLLTNKKIYYYIFNSQSLILLNEYEFEENGNFIICSEPYVFIIGSEIQVLNIELDTVLKIIPLPGTPTSVFNNFYVIYVQIEDFIYLINGDSPVVQSLVDSFPGKNCQFFSSFLNALSVCKNSAYLYFDKCDHLCYKTIDVNFSLKNPKVIDEGFSYLNVYSNIIGNNSNLEFNCLYNLYTYSFYLLFYDNEIKKNNIFEYDNQMIWPLNNEFLGFDIEYQLYINKSSNIDPDFPLKLKPRVLNQTYYELSEFNFIDHDIIPGNQFVLILSNDSIIVLNNSVPSGLTIPYHLKALKVIPQSEYFNVTGNCKSINYISTKGIHSLFVLNCEEIKEYTYYYQDINTIYEQKYKFLIFFEFNFEKLQLNYVYYVEYNHHIDWIQIVTSSSSCFMVLCIDKIDENENALFFSINNNLEVYSGSWFNNIKILHQITINFSKLNLNRLQIINADGIYISTPTCSSLGTLYLYLSDIFYGIRILKVTNKTVELFSSINYRNEYVQSIAVCGTSVFSISNLTFIDEYFIGKNYNLTFYQTIPPSYNSNLTGAISFLSCSSYYRPHYLAVYLQSKVPNYYQLRLIDLYSLSFTSYFKFINLPIINPLTYSFTYKGKSRFTGNSTVTALGVNTGNFYSFLISEIELYFDSMTKPEYTSLIDKYKSNVFEIVIQYRNQYLTKNSTNFIFSIVSPATTSSDHDSSLSTWWIWVVAGTVLVTVAIASFLIYKKIINRKKKNDLKLKTFVISTELGKKGRLGLLINHEDTLNNY